MKDIDIYIQEINALKNIISKQNSVIVVQGFIITDIQSALERKEQLERVIAELDLATHQQNPVESEQVGTNKGDLECPI